MVRRIQNGDRLTVVACFLEERGGLLVVLRALVGLAACIRLHGNAAAEIREADCLQLGIGSDRVQIIGVVDDVVHRLPRLHIVEGRMKVVELNDAHRARRGMDLELDVGIGLEHRQEVGLRILEVVDLARHQSSLRGLRIGEPRELDAIDLHDLAARMARSRLLARHIAFELLVDSLAARHPLVTLEGERAGADHFLDLLEGINQGLFLAHHERNAGARLRQRVDDEAVGLLEAPHEGLVVLRCQRFRVAHELLAGAVTLAPALHRRDDIFARHRRTIMERQAVAQRERVDLAVIAHCPLVDHLRLRIEVAIEREERVVDHHAVDARDRLGGPERIQRADVGVHGDTQHLRLLRQRRRRRQRHRQCGKT